MRIAWIHRFSAFTWLTVAALFSSAALSPRYSLNQDAWPAPKYADTLKNPLLNDPQAAAQGKILFTKMCASCHGSKGRGDGIAGMSLNPRPHDLIIPQVQTQTDGALFWKITNGKSPMPAYQATLKNEQRWQLVNFIRQLQSK